MIMPWIMSSNLSSISSLASILYRKGNKDSCFRLSLAPVARGSGLSLGFMATVDAFLWGAQACQGLPALHYAWVTIWMTHRSKVNSEDCVCVRLPAVRTCRFPLENEAQMCSYNRERKVSLCFCHLERQPRNSINLYINQSLWCYLKKKFLWKHILPVCMKSYFCFSLRTSYHMYILPKIFTPCKTFFWARSRSSRQQRIITNITCFCKECLQRREGLPTWLSNDRWRQH